MTVPSLDPQVLASNPDASIFVSANAGSGKTSTLVKRVARLLLAGARPEAILCVTYTKAGAAEMQRRLFEKLGDWAVMRDEALVTELAGIEEAHRDLSKARALFARALETPGGLQIQTIHSFCEKLLRRFPLEAGVSPGFAVLEDLAAQDVAARARERVAALTLSDPHGQLAAAYERFSIALGFDAFNAMFKTFEDRRKAIEAYAARAEFKGGYNLDVWRRCGFPQATSTEAIEREAMARIRWGAWKRTAEAVARGTGVTDQKLAAQMMALSEGARFADIADIFLTKDGSPRTRLGTNAVDAGAREWLKAEQDYCVETRRALTAAVIAEDTIDALTIARTYGGCYEDAKAARGGLDFADLIAHANALLTERADAAWVLFKMDGGIEHVLLDEAQDTAPEQWEILRALTAEFFTGAGAAAVKRTMFAVGDEKQSIFSFQGAAPERLGVEAQAFGEAAYDASLRFDQVPLLESWRSAPEILSFVDAVCAIGEIKAGLRPSAGGNVESLPIEHKARRHAGGCVELWPLDVNGPVIEPDPWAPVDAEPAASAVKTLARRIAVGIKGMIARGDAVMDRETHGPRPCAAGDMLILVRRRNALFHEIIRALKREGVPVAGADRLKLSEHGVFDDLMALGRFARFPGDDLTLAGLLRSPFCDVDEQGLFDLAHKRSGTLWAALTARAGERPDWAAAADILGWARDDAARRSPFDFYSRALSRLDGAGRSMRQRFLTRLGAEGEEALDAFVAQSLAAEARGVRDLEAFLAEMAATELEIKREADQARARDGGEARVMTVHGAKGLEAPVVFLPDTTTRAKPAQQPLLQTADGGFLWAPRKPADCTASAEARAAREAAGDQESARLLYVALTRARDRLIVAGVQTRDQDYLLSWHDFVRRAFDELPIRPFALDDGAEAWRYGADPLAAPVTERPAAADVALPAWTRGLAPAEPALARFASPSTLADGAPLAAPSPLAAAGGLGRFRRGDLIHTLLQLLPDLAATERADAAARRLAREQDLTDDQRGEIAGAALAVLTDPRFAAVFGPNSRAEVAIAGGAKSLPKDFAISGRIDRLVVEPERVLVIDFKTNRPAPDRVEDAAPAYIQQMALYAAVLAEVYPGRAIEAALVWTDGPKLMAVPAELMEKALKDLPTTS